VQFSGGRCCLKVLEGSHISKLDDKGRVTIKPDHRDVIGREVVLAPGLDPCVVLYPSLEWQHHRSALDRADLHDADADDLIRHVIGGAHTTQVDQRYGRVHLPSPLLHWAGIDEGEGREVLVIACLKRIEFWNPDTYREYMRERAPLLKETRRRLLAGERGEAP